MLTEIEQKKLTSSKNTEISLKEIHSITLETLDNNRMHNKGSLTPLEEAFWIFECSDLEITKRKITIEGRTQEFSYQICSSKPKKPLGSLKTNYISIFGSFFT